ncbi:hypothetical protein GLAREA_00934 [Glarea lozoyensis ATCC 20868]|uniref:Uncharacterized protein n=1 Tax=Glarea lozoyensis (strain ATCC 20868 / MF5171) TaxID=1116229 RepID=S3CXX4_GLAL2|nr:uncharacterized protein GLAREA_00934 [Glarea lozoyensis ATCC 20868]EPE29774.1 hypothetical protein GLAREA_00934 [Glarea lozoyensis ATCC 20868]
MAASALISNQSRKELPAVEAPNTTVYPSTPRIAGVERLGFAVDLPNKFLSLTPSTGASYLERRQPSPGVEASNMLLGIRKAGGPASITNPKATGHDVLGASRSSSMSSEASADTSRSQSKWFLRLDPVHDGEHLDKNGDWSEEVIIC